MTSPDPMLTEIVKEFPNFRIVEKRDHRLSWLIDAALKLITLGRQRHYLTHYHTVIGDTLYVPLSWASASPIDRAILLRHERVHLRQRRRYGTVGMAIIYLIPFFPLGLAYGRARLEWEAYEETLRATAQFRGVSAAKSAELRAQIVQRFVGPDYGWMWPFRRQVERWYDQMLSTLEGELGRPTCTAEETK